MYLIPYPRNQIRWGQFLPESTERRVITVDPLRVECPVCHAPVGKDCTDTLPPNVRGNFEVRYQHGERFTAAEMSPEDRVRAIR